MAEAAKARAVSKIEISFRSTGEANMRAESRRFVKILGEAALVASDNAAVRAQRQIRRDMEGARLRGLSRTVKATSDRKKQVRPIVSTDMKWRAGAAVFRRTDKSPRAAGAWEAYSRGPVIVPKRGRWLAFPTGNVPKRAGRKKMTPALYNAGGFASKHGPLVFIKGPTAGVAYLIAKDVTVRSGNERGAAKVRGPRGGTRGRARREFVVMFILIRRTKRDVRFRPLDEVRRQSALIPKEMDQFIRKSLARRGASLVSGVQSSGRVG